MYCKVILKKISLVSVRILKAQSLKTFLLAKRFPNVAGEPNRLKMGHNKMSEATEALYKLVSNVDKPIVYNTEIKHKLN